MNLAASIDFQALMEPVALHFFGDPNIALSKQGKELRWGARGSLSVNCEKGTWFNHETNAGGGVLDMIRSETGRDHANCIAWLRQQKFVLNGVSHGDSQSKVAIARPKPRIVCTYEYTDEFGALLYEVVRFEPKDFRQRRPDGLGGWIWNLDDTRRVLYRLPELIESRALDHPIFIVEGEKDVENLRALNISAFWMIAVLPLPSSSRLLTQVIASGALSISASITRCLHLASNGSSEQRTAPGSLPPMSQYR